MLVAVLCDRGAITMRNLAISSLVILILMPHEMMGPSFQMSFSATAALVAAYGWWSEHRVRRESEQAGLWRKGKQGNWVIRFVMVPALSTAFASLVAGSSSGIFAAFHFANMAPLGILGNMMALPVMSFVVMPCGVLAALLMPLGLEWLPLQIMGLGVDWVRQVAFFIAEISPEIQPKSMPLQSLALFTIGLILLVLLRSYLRLLAVFPLFWAVTLYWNAPMPLLLVSEDGRLVAVRVEGKKLALSNLNPPDFILSNWLPVFHVSRDFVLLPQQPGEGGKGFICQGSLCRAHLAGGADVVTVALAASKQQQACRDGDIVILTYLGAQAEACGGDKPVITLAQLALYGTAALYGTSDGYQIEWTIGKKRRPWYQHRAVSKAVLGMP